MSLSKPSGRNKRSELWSFFSIIDAEYAKCDLCSHKICYRTTNSNLKKHLDRKQPTVMLPKSTKKPKLSVQNYSEDGDDPAPLAPPAQPTTALTSVFQPRPSSSSVSQSAELAVCQGTSKGTSTLDEGKSRPSSTVNPKICLKNGTQSTMSQFLPKKMTVASKHKINKELMKLFTVDMQPFRIVEDEGFRTFVKALNPSYDLPSRQSISKTMLPALYEKCKVATQEALKDAVSVCLTTDCWTSTNSESFMAITVHFVSSDFEIKSALLECAPMSERHTSENLAAAILDCVMKWGLENKILLAVSDNASNIKKALNDVLSWNFYGCLAHKINLIVRDSLVTVEDVLTKIRGVVTHFKRSNNSSEKLIAYQRNSGLEPKKLIQDICTRWNSTYLMLDRFCELEEAIKSTLALIDKDLPVISSEEWKVAKELRIILKPFYEVTTSISGEKYASASLVIVLSYGLKDICSKLKAKEFADKIKTVITKLETGTCSRLGNVELNSTLLVSMFLDPRFKTSFQSQSLADKVRTMVVNLIAAKVKKGVQEQESMKDANMSENKKKLTKKMNFLLGLGWINSSQPHQR